MKKDLEKAADGSLVVSEDEVNKLKELVEKHKKSTYGASIKKKMVAGFEIGELTELIFSSPGIVHFMEIQKQFVEKYGVEQKKRFGLQRVSTYASVKTWYELESFYELHKGSGQDCRIDLFLPLRARIYKLIKYLSKRIEPREQEIYRKAMRRIKYNASKKYS